MKLIYLKSFENIEKENIKINNEIGDADKFKGYKKNFQIKMLEYKKTYKEIQDNRKPLSIGYKTIFSNRTKRWLFK